MIYAAPGASTEFTFQGLTGLVGTLGIRITEGSTDTETIARTTAGINEHGTTGVYTATLTVPIVAGQYTVIWDTGGATPSYATEDLTVTYSAPGPSGAPGTPFITIGELGDRLGVSAATARGTAVITAASDMVRLFTEQELYPVVDGGTVTLDGTGTDSLLLPEGPVLNAGTVVESGGTLTPDTDYKLNNNGVLYRLPGVIDSGWSTYETRTYWWPGRQNIEVTYSHGYDSVPAELKEVALSMAARLFNQPNGNVVFEQLGQKSIRYAGPASDWTTTERIVLAKYKQAK